MLRRLLDLRKLSLSLLEALVLACGAEVLVHDKFCTPLQVEQLAGAELADFLLSLEPEGWNRSKAIADRPRQHHISTVSSWPQPVDISALLEQSSVCHVGATPLGAATCS